MPPKILKSTSTGWDPLLIAKEFDPEMVSASIKRDIKNILKSYVGIYDPFAELIQNALDAVDKRDRISKRNKGSYKKKIWLTIDLKENSFTIVDNGVGFQEKEFKAFLVPHISFKTNKNSRGNKGVGATYIAYGFNHLELGTKNENYEFYGKIENGRDWIEDLNGNVPRPEIKKARCNDKFFKYVDKGSIFKLVFGGVYTRPKDLSYTQATSAEQWLYPLLIKTPLGIVDVLQENQSDIIFELNVIDKNGKNTLKVERAAYKYPHEVINASESLATIRLEQEKLKKKGTDTSKLPKRFQNLNGIYDVFSSDDIKKLPTNKLNNDEIDLIDTYKVSAYGYFVYSTSVWDTLNDEIARLRKNLRILKGGIQLSNNSMVQGEMLLIPLTQSIGYQNQTHIIVHFENADPDLGRKGFQPELKELAENISVGIVNRLKQWRHLLKIDKGNRPDVSREKELHQWVKEQEEFEKTHPLNISNPHFFNPVNEISISSEPQSEQDVIVLFNQLLAGGVIRGMKLLSTSQYKQYDGLFKFVTAPPMKNHIYNKQTNPLGVQTEQYSEGTISIPKVLEYKYSLDALIHEIENNEKKEKEISLVIVWDVGQEWQRHYEVVSLLDPVNLHHRQFHGVTHTFYTATSQFDAIVLKELIQYLNDPTNAIKFQKKTYSEDISK